MRCRLCGAGNLTTVLDLGEQALTGVFPASADEPVGRGPLALKWCQWCTLAQLGASHDPAEMYGDNYGYRSGLNRSMVEHLEQKVRWLEKMMGLGPDDVVLDIGCNDGTLLKSYTKGPWRIGIDPTASKFSRYHDGIEAVIPDFFSVERFWEAASSGYRDRAKVITSIAMFYDLEDPVAFARDVRDCLDRYGVWHFEQSYMPSMLTQTSYDMVCHEHLEYYSLTAVRQILDLADLKIIDVRFNDVNGGSFAVTAGHAESYTTSVLAETVLAQEERFGIHTMEPFRRFAKRAAEHRGSLRSLIRGLRHDGMSVMGYGASTKGNVLLQYCGFGPQEIEAIAEVNEDKFGRVTPGTNIPIISETEMRERNPDYLLVLPWHFRDGIIEREREYLRGGGLMLFPLPEIAIVGAP